MATTQERLADAVSLMVTEQRLARTEAQVRAEHDRAPKTVAKAIGQESTTTLMALCQVGSEADLPKFWNDLAAAGKRDRQALEQAMLSKARDINMAEVAPVATPDLVKKVIGLQWHGLNADDLSEGIQPF
ncbi:hypothetical protein JZU56_01370, partial [bacterium]|nr:hypothetical protein [bacterium]